ncbi:DUF1800 domain-containing protein [Wenzhouxiangella sp. XN79A]|uniref:DUF1800 domain-containing protein n=1 Tax=Wenzhouxiangella sp. XN79A TaxID=2724193 RepID=UPI00144A53A0|nr:DUF1800 domain-containing protein [Wenzhouxiangella sp. XN79A]NKI34300.1 DUF1800 domain-containing protein [Wenzhouxiangella sp. XN79A]
MNSTPSSTQDSPRPDAAGADSRRRFLLGSGTLGLAVAGIGAGLIPITALAEQVRLTSLWPARLPSAGRGAALPSLAYRVYSKLAFGPRPANPANPGDVDDLTWFQGLGTSDAQRLDAWLNEQMSPGPDPAVDARLSANPHWRTLGQSLQQLWTEHHRYSGPDGWPMRNRPYWEMQMLALTRMVHSRWQLREVLADFWHNHFNVDGGEEVVRSTLTSYDRDVIRPQIFGNFRVMLEGVVKHAAMMYYLDNRRNSTPNPNENYARELLELHTLGAVENYYGFVPPGQVPTNVDGEPAGYVEADVLETARLLTGFGVADGDDSAPDTGAFLFRSDWHDWTSKTILGRTYPGTGEQELSDLLDDLARHRGTAEYVCWKLAVRLIGDGFSASSPVVQAAADLFQAGWDQPDQLQQVYRALILSSEFQSTWSDKVKRPTEIIASALRAANAPYDFELNSAADNAGFPGFYWTWRLTGQLPFNCEPPTGYPEDAAFWKGSGPLVMSWRTVTRMLRDVASANAPTWINFAERTNAAGIALTPDAIADYWLNRIQGAGHATSAAKRAELVAFLREQGNAAGNDQPLAIDTSNTAEWSTYQHLMRGLFTLIALLPERMAR